MKICLHLHIIDLSQRGNSFYPCLYTHTYNQPLICASVCVCVPSDLLHIVLRLHVLIFLCMCVCVSVYMECVLEKGELFFAFVYNAISLPSLVAL